MSNVKQLYILLFLFISPLVFAKVVVINSDEKPFLNTICLADNSNIPLIEQLGKFVPLTGNLDQMKYFYQALLKAKTKGVRIAHYGDSLILGDVITEYLRENFQEKFTGRGAGMLGIVSDDFRMRRTTVHSYSTDWEYYSFITRNPKQVPFGISGGVSIPKPGSWVKYECSKALKSSSSFDVVKVYYTFAESNSTIQYSIDNGPLKTTTLEPGTDVKELVIPASSASKVFYMKFVSGKEPTFYGASLETSKNGVIVDNFPMRGNSGASLLEIPETTLRDFNKHLDYDLIILNYGANVSSPNKGIYTVYENKMVNVIEQYKKAFPTTSFLIVSSGDRTIKKGSSFITNPDVKLLLEAQKKITERTGVAFWNLWESMGGENSMTNWVDAAPSMAMKDYAHFTNNGGERVAELFFQSLMDGFQKYSK